MTMLLALFAPEDEAMLRPYAAQLGCAEPEVAFADRMTAAQVRNYSHVIAVSHDASRLCLARWGAQLDVQPITGVCDVHASRRFTRMAFGGKAFVTVESDDPIILLSVNLPTPDQPQIVVSGGMGMGSRAGFDLIQALAQRLGARVGASLAAIDADYADMEHLVGLGAGEIAPDLYLAFGISGANEHMWALRRAKKVIAINSDSDASIFKRCDYGLVGDVFDVLPALIKKLSD